MAWAAALSVLLAGCTAPQPAEDDRGDSSGLRLPAFPGIWPVLINSTAVPGRLGLNLTNQVPCHRTLGDWPQRLTYSLYDRHGLVFRHHEVMPSGRGPFLFDVPAHGQPPFLFAMDKNPCLDSWNSFVTGIGEGMVLDSFHGYFPRGYTANDSFQRPVINVTVPLGGTGAEVDWTPEPEVWYLDQVGLEHRTGNRNGNISLIDSGGNVTMYSDWPVGGGMHP